MISQRCALFDFDGLLVNSEYLHYEAYKLMLAEYSLVMKEDFLTFSFYAHMSSDGLREFLQKTYPTLTQLPWATLYEKKQAFFLKLLQTKGPDLLPGVARLIEILHSHEIPMAVATNSRKIHIELVKERLPILGKIPHWITREDYPKPKPAPDAYIAALRALGADAETAIGFEDSLRGVEALEAAGVYPICICPEDHPQRQNSRFETLETYESMDQFIDRSIHFPLLVGVLDS